MNYQNPYPQQGYRYQPYQPLQQSAVPVPNVQPIQQTVPVQQWQQPVPQAPVEQQAPPEAPVMQGSNDALAQAINRLCDLTEALYSDYRKEVQKIWTSDR